MIYNAEVSNIAWSRISNNVFLWWCLTMRGLALFIFDRYYRNITLDYRNITLVLLVLMTSWITK